MSNKPIAPGNKVFYWQEDKCKIKADGTKGGVWIKGKAISVEGAMIGVDLGSRIVKVNVSLLRRDDTIAPSKPGIELPERDHPPPLRVRGKSAPKILYMKTPESFSVVMVLPMPKPTGIVR